MRKLLRNLQHSSSKTHSKFFALCSQFPMVQPAQSFYMFPMGQLFEGGPTKALTKREV